MEDNNPNEGENINGNFMNAMNNNNIYQNSFFDTITSSDFLSLSLDFVPSMIYLTCISLAFIVTIPIDENFILLLKTFMLLYSFYIIKGLFHSLFIKLNKMNISFYKVSISTMDSILTICYYLITVFGYYIILQRKDLCFIKNTYMTCLTFYLITVGFVNLGQDLLTMIIIVICFPIMVYYFTRDPNSFYSNIGIDPEIINNLPTTKADQNHTGECVICTEVIKEGEEILVLKCPGKHYFHGACIKPWLRNKMSCPTCRNSNII